MYTDWLIALGICIATAMVEGLCAGKDPMGELRKLRQPSWSPPNWAWVLVGLAWYGICLTALIRLLPDFNARPVPALLLIELMLVNAAVNFVQFRMKRLDLALASFVPYWALLGTFLVAVWPVDPPTAWLFSIYAIYQVYAAAWVHSLWRLNRESGLG